MDPLEPILDQLTDLYQRMDQAYGHVAQHYGFNCTGCRDNCCRTLFYHHTYVECLYLSAGLHNLLPEQQQKLKNQAAEACRLTEEAINNGDPAPRILCPLNEADRCVLYIHRPMICRLHGVPHRLIRPDGRMQAGPGCGDFENQYQTPNQIQLDRTPLYRSMVDIEHKVRGRFALTKKIRMTVAQMLLCEDPLEFINPGKPLP